MFRYHEDPKDFFRPTHFHITKILERAGFKVETYLIGVGPVKVIAEITVATVMMVVTVTGKVSVCMRVALWVVERRHLPLQEANQKLGTDKARDLPVFAAHASDGLLAGQVQVFAV